MISFITDLHLTETTPVSRLDSDYFSFQLDRLDWCMKKALTKGASAMLIGGDVFDHYLGSVNMINAVHPSLIKVPTFTCIGNHDVMGRNTANLNLSALECLNNKSLTIGSELEFIKIGPYRIHFIHWNTKKANDFLKDDYEIPCDKEEGIIDICIAHLPIANKESAWAIDVKSMKSYFYDFVLIGDQHFGFDPYTTKKGTTLINPGAFAVSKADEYKRIPGIVFIDGGKYEILPIPQPEYKKVFKVDLIEAQKQKKESRAKGAGIALRNKEKGLTGRKLVEQVAKELKYPKEVVDTVLKHM